MWDIVGGRNVRNRQLLISNISELSSICKHILDGCDNEKIRYEAKIMKAKLLFVSGQKDVAVDILNSLPKRSESSEQQLELLHDLGTTESIYWTKRNVYAIADGLAFKLVKSIWRDDQIPIETRIDDIVQIGELIHQCWLKTRQTMFLVMAHMIFAIFSKELLLIDAKEDDIVKNISFQLNEAKQITQVASEDKALKDLLIRTYKTDNLLQYTLNYLKNADSSIYTKIRLNPSFNEILSKITKE